MSEKILKKLAFSSKKEPHVLFQMNIDLITNIREWAPLTDLLNKVPVKVQKGFLQQELSVVCVDVLHNFIGLGTDAGIVFWYNRLTKDVQKLRCEVNKKKLFLISVPRH